MQVQKIVVFFSFLVIGCFSSFLDAKKDPNAGIKKWIKLDRIKKRCIGCPLDEKSFWVSSLFGAKRSKKGGGYRIHKGIDMAAFTGTPIMAAFHGFVVEAEKNVPGYGHMVLIDHQNGYKTRYAHMNAIKVRKGQYVKRKQIIGTVGATGRIMKKGKDGSHLHFEIIHRGKPCNPLYYFNPNWL